MLVDMVNNADSIENGLRLSKLDDGNRGNFWFDCKKAVDIHMRPINDPIKKSKIIAHIFVMQLSHRVYSYYIMIKYLLIKLIKNFGEQFIFNFYVPLI